VLEGSRSGWRCRPTGSTVVRFFDGRVVVVKRGTAWRCTQCAGPDVREQHKRDLIDIGRHREVLMLVPSSIGLVNLADLLKR
jgi:hypothetical protein